MVTNEATLLSLKLYKEIIQSSNVTCGMDKMLFLNYTYLSFYENAILSIISLIDYRVQSDFQEKISPMSLKIYTFSYIHVFCTNLLEILYDFP